MNDQQVIDDLEAAALDGHDATGLKWAWIETLRAFLYAANPDDHYHHPDLTPATRLVAIMLAEHASDDDVSRLSVVDLQTRLDLSEKTVLNSIKCLEQLGVITVTRRTGHANRIVLNPRCRWEQAADYTDERKAKIGNRAASKGSTPTTANSLEGGTITRRTVPVPFTVDEMRVELVDLTTEHQLFHWWILNNERVPAGEVHKELGYRERSPQEQVYDECVRRARAEGYGLARELSLPPVEQLVPGSLAWFPPSRSVTRTSYRPAWLDDDMVVAFCHAHHPDVEQVPA